MKGKTSQRIRRLQDLMINVTLSLLKAYFQNANLVPSAYFRYEKEKEDKISLGTRLPESLFQKEC